MAAGSRVIPSLTKLADILFSEGWLFLVPYVVLYAAAWAVGLPTSWLYRCFLGLHVFNLGTLALFARARRREWKIDDWLFWGGLITAFLIPGAYLEYPSDPWEHFRRIFRWQSIPTIANYEPALRAKFSYFWAWSFLGEVPLEWRRPAVGAYAALVQLLLSLQVYSLARKLGASPPWAKLHVVAFWILFGTSVFSWRYYSLSSTPLAFLAYLFLLGEILENARNGKALRPWYFAAAGALIVFNHVAELAFLVFAVVVVQGVRWLGGLRVHRGTIVVVAYLGWFVSLGAGVLLLYRFPQLFHNIQLRQITELGIVRVWDPRLQYLETWGFHGLLSLGLSLFLIKRHRFAVALGWAPLLVLLFPFSVALWSKLIGPYGPAYRILYAFPTSFLLVLALETLTGRWSGRRALIVATIAVVVLASRSSFPWRGRLFFQFHVPYPERTLKPLDETARWFATHRALPKSCLLVTDDISDFLLSTHLGRERRGDRLSPWMHYRVLRNPPKFVDFILKPELCGILLPDPSKMTEQRPSFVAQKSGHWLATGADQGHLLGDVFPRLDRALDSTLWSRTAVPPYYTFYELKPGRRPPTELDY